jgi:hypothetical protein
MASVSLTAGCLSNESSVSEETSEPTPTPSATPTPEELVDRLPERSPLADPLVTLLLAENREQTAEEFGLDYRPETNAVRALIELEPEASLPGRYRLSVLSKQNNNVIAYVHVFDLVPVAMADPVRRVQQPPTSKTTG